MNGGDLNGRFWLPIRALLLGWRFARVMSAPEICEKARIGIIKIWLRNLWG